jgi:outer membrane protein OmpA-like peptidoglycan-associated protein
MLLQLIRSVRRKQEAERPFWISYADLMTAMMTLCLVAMAVTILAMSQELRRELSAEDTRAQQILNICNEIKSGISDHPAIHVDCRDNRIDFGEAGQFGYQEYRLHPEVQSDLAALVPVILQASSSVDGRKWFKQVVIEGFTDTRGPYLYNLYLSLKRSYWMMCLLVDPKRNGALGLSEDQVLQVRDLFLAGGVSFNDAKESDDASRRVELRLQFFTRKEREEPGRSARPNIVPTQQESCELG